MADNLGASTRRLAAGRPAVFTWRSGAQTDIRMGAGYGMLNALFYAEERAKEDSVVRGGHRSFYTGAHLGGPLGMTEHAATPRGKGHVGGHLRRSWYSAVTVSGVLIPGSRIRGQDGDEGHRPLGLGPSGIEGAFGNAANYSGWVDQGTSKMPARPMAMPALNAMAGAYASLFRAGAYAFWNSRPQG